MLVLEQVATVDKDFLSLPVERSQAFLERNAGFIRRLQHAELADPNLDPDLAALVLSVMVSRSANAVLAVGFRDADLAALAATVTRLWLNSLRRRPTADGRPWHGADPGTLPEPAGPVSFMPLPPGGPRRPADEHRAGPERR